MTPGALAAPCHVESAGQAFRDRVDPVVGRQHDQCLVQPDGLVDVAEEVGKERVHPEHVVFVLEAVGPKSMAQIVGRREAHRQEVGGAALADLFLLHQFLDEVQGHAVAHGGEPQGLVEILFLLCAQLVRKGRLQVLVALFRRTVVRVAVDVLRPRLHQVPGTGLVLAGVIGLVPCRHPGRVRVVVKGAGNELPGTGGIPERLAQLTAGNDGAPVLDRNREHPRRPARGEHKLVPDGAGGQVARRRSLMLGLRRRLLAEDRIVRVLDAVDPLSASLVIPVVPGHAMLGGVAAGEQGRVADGGKRRGMRVMGVGERRAAVHQVAETALAETVVVPPRHVAAQLIDGDLNDQLGIFRDRPRRREQKRRQHQEWYRRQR